MTDHARNHDTDSHDARSAKYGVASGSSSVTGNAISKTATATEPNVSDQTVISQSPPLLLQSPEQAFNPRELGHALEGRQLDHVVLEQFVGGGGMGAVFRAWDTSLYRTVAVKVLSTYQVGDVDSQRRFQTEARSAARLDHPNIARVHYVGEDDGIRYIVFEYIDGTNVRDMVHAKGALPVAEALNYTLQVANALTHAWEREVVHRDIKPSNILVTNDGLAKLVDMGLARLEHVEGADQEETAAGVTLGTFDYISPEQARNPRDADMRSDIYSLGCTLFYMLTGRAPFSDAPVLQKLLQHQTEAPPDVREFRPDVPDALASVISRMLAKRPEDRFADPTELATALVGCIEQLGITPPQVALPAYWTDWVPRQSWWRRHAPWIVPVVLLLFSVLALGIKWRQEAAMPAFPELDIPQSATISDAAKSGESQSTSSTTDGSSIINSNQ